MQKTISKSNRKIGKAYRKQKRSRLKRAHRKALRAQKNRGRR